MIDFELEDENLEVLEKNIDFCKKMILSYQYKLLNLETQLKTKVKIEASKIENTYPKIWSN